MRSIGRWCLFTTNALDISAFGKLTCVSYRVSFKRVGGNEVAQMFPLGSKGNTVLAVHELAEMKAPDGSMTEAAVGSPGCCIGEALCYVMELSLGS